MRVESLILGVGVLFAGCGFDSGGLGESAEEAGDGDEAADTSGSEGVEAGNEGDGDGDTGGDGDGDSTGDGDGDGDGDTTGDGDGDTTGDGDGDTNDPCEGYQLDLLLLASDGEVVDPMALHGDPNMNQGIYAQSEVADEGTITWSFDLECPVEVVIWGVVWDQNPGANGGDPDSFWMQVDSEEPEHKWVYGCGTDGLDGGWSYQRVSHNLGTDFCDLQSLSWNLGPGAHEVRLRNREYAPNFDAAAAVARILVTSELDYVPTLQTD